MTIDSQCHVSSLWYEPVESLLNQMARVGVTQAVLIQMLGQTDNDYQQSCLERFPGRFASVVIVDPCSPTVLDDLRALAEQGASGLRLRPGARSPGADPLAIWRCAQDLKLAISCVGSSEAFCSAEFAELVGALPRLSIVLEHLGGTSSPDSDEAALQLRLRAMALSRFPNVFMKVPGLGELLPRKPPPFGGASPFSGEVPQVLSHALQSFTSQRLMWGSDFPPVSSREGYGNALNLCRQALDKLSSAEKQDIFENVARDVFRLPMNTMPRQRFEPEEPKR